MKRVLTLLDALCRLGAGLGALCLALLFSVGLTEIICRNFFGYSLGFASEYAAYGVAIVLLLGSGEAVRTGAHVRVGLVSEALAGEHQRAVDIAATLLGLAVAMLFAFAAIRYAFVTGMQGTVSYFPSQTPLVIPQGFVALGPVTLVAGLVARLLRLLDGDDAVALPAEKTKGKKA